MAAPARIRRFRFHSSMRPRAVHLVRGTANGDSAKFVCIFDLNKSVAHPKQFRPRHLRLPMSRRITPFSKTRAIPPSIDPSFKEVIDAQQRLATDVDNGRPLASVS